MSNKITVRNIIKAKMNQIDKNKYRLREDENLYQLNDDLVYFSIVLKLVFVHLNQSVYNTAYKIENATMNKFTEIMYS